MSDPNLSKTEREELEELRAVLRQDVCSPRLIADIALHEFERCLAIHDLISEVKALRCGVGVTYPTTADPLAYTGDPVRRLWVDSLGTRDGTLELIAQCKRFATKHKGEPAGNPLLAQSVPQEPTA